MNDAQENQTTPLPDKLVAALYMTDNIRSNLDQGVKALSLAQAYVIDCHEMAQAAADERTTLAKAIDRTKELRKGFLKPAQDIIDNANALFNPAIENMEAARKFLGGEIQAWNESERKRIAAEQAKRDEEQRKLRQAAEANAAAELARAEQQAAEQRRIAQEAEERRAKAEAEGNARAAATAAAESAKAAEKAQAAIETGNAKAMEAQMRATAAAPEPVAEVKKIAGASERDNWVAELKDGVTEDAARALIVAAVASRPDLLGLLKLDHSAIKSMAKLKSAANIPGFNVVNRPNLAGKRK